MKQQRGQRMSRELAALAAVVVREEQEALRADAFEQNDASGRPAVVPDGGERHRGRLGNVGALRVGQPALELRDRTGIDVSFIERGAMVFAAYVGNAHCGRDQRGGVTRLSVI